MGVEVLLLAALGGALIGLLLTLFGGGGSRLRGLIETLET